jgi:hypothetical protein
MRDAELSACCIAACSMGALGVEDAGMDLSSVAAAMSF